MFFLSIIHIVNLYTALCSTYFIGLRTFTAHAMRIRVEERSSNLIRWLRVQGRRFYCVMKLSYQSGIIVSHEAHSDRLLLESLGACLTKISIASSSYSSLCCGESSSRDSNLMKALDVVPKALLV